MEGRRKSIPLAREQVQSSALTWTVSSMLVAALAGFSWLMLRTPHPQPGWTSCSIWAVVWSLTFAGMVWGLRAATLPAALCGALICFLVTLGSVHFIAPSAFRSGLLPLGVLFLLTHLATRAGKVQKAKMGLAEPRKGRNTAQVIANLGAAGLIATASAVRFCGPEQNAHSIDTPLLSILAMLLAVLGEATADTVSSEIGQVFGGRPYLLTTLRRVDPGTDGGVSLRGTLAGGFAALIVIATGVWALGVDWHIGAAGYAGGIAGLIFDSLLGATAEQRGMVGNDLVNFTSTLFAALVAFALVSHR